MQDVHDENDNPIGRFLFADMNISISTSAFDLGEHTLMVRVQTPHDQVFSQSWQFVIRERETPRLETPPEVAPTADYLRQFPLPTPAFLLSLSTQSTLQDRFSPIGLGEGLCLVVDDEPFVPPELAHNPFRPAMWEEIVVSVNNVRLNDTQIGIRGSDSPGVLFLCIDTDFLAPGTHLAELDVTANGRMYAYQWAFVIE